MVIVVLLQLLSNEAIGYFGLNRLIHELIEVPANNTLNWMQSDLNIRVISMGAYL